MLRLGFTFISALLTTSKAYKYTCKKLFAAYNTIAVLGTEWSQKCRRNAYP